MTFAERMQPAFVHEQDVIDRLLGAGYLAERFGQGLLTEPSRRALARCLDDAHRPTLIRWMPDVIAFGGRPGWRLGAMLIDAKVCTSATGNYAVEKNAVDVAGIYTDLLFTPTFFVFDDWGVLTPRDARLAGWHGPDPRAGRGSGTPYLLIDKRHARPFDDVFPPLLVDGDPA